MAKKPKVTGWHVTRTIREEFWVEAATKADALKVAVEPTEVKVISETARRVGSGTKKKPTGVKLRGSFPYH